MSQLESTLATDTPPPLPDHFPTVIVDTKVRCGVDDLAINFHQLTDTLTENGLTPEQIDETTIIISADEDTRHNIGVGGRYKSETKEVYIYPLDGISRSINRFAQSTDPEYRTAYHESGGTFLAWKLDLVLRHELEHRIVDAEGGMPEQARHERNTQRKVVAATLSPIAGAVGAVIAKENYLPSSSLSELTATYVVALGAAATGALLGPRGIMERAYKNSPEEDRAYGHEGDFRTGYFAIRFSYQNEPLEELSTEQGSGAEQP